MIKLLCTKCMSDCIHYIDDDRIDEWFKCEECEVEFTFHDANWETEF